MSSRTLPVVVGFARTPIGSFLGSLQSLSATKLGSIAIRAALERSGVKPEQVGEVYMGNVVSAGLGQAPARQAALGAGLPPSVVCTTVNKVCASGTKTTVLAAQAVLLGLQDVVVAGGMESMSNIPFILRGARQGFKYGDTTLADGLALDGLSDAYSCKAMGTIGDSVAETFGLTRQMQDDFALESYARAQRASKDGVFAREIVPVSTGKDVTVSTDEEPFRLKADKVPTLKPAFGPKGTVTAANASKLNDGAAALVVASEAAARQSGWKPLARIIGFGDAERKPDEFPIAPADAIPLAVKRAGLQLADIDLFEINEAFASVVLANQKLLSLDPARINIYGGAIALGHPIGCSGARIIGTLLNALTLTGKRYGVAAICNGGGGASAIVIERVVA